MTLSIHENPYGRMFGIPLNVDRGTRVASNTQNPFKMCFMNFIQELPQQIPDRSIKSAIGTFTLSVLFGSTVSSAAILASVGALATLVDAVIRPVLAEIVDQNSFVGRAIRLSLTYIAIENILTSFAPFVVVERTLTQSLSAMALKIYLLTSQCPAYQNTASIYIL
jgi:MFS-type transporter involved in bile tolerance (Atg22 family)